MTKSCVSSLRRNSVRISRSFLPAIAVLNFSRLLKNAHLRRCPHPSSLRRTTKYVSLLRISGALHLGIFEQPMKIDFFSMLLMIDRGDVINFRKVTVGFVEVNTIANDKDIIDLFPEVVSLDLHFSPCLLVQKSAYLYGVGVR